MFLGISCSCTLDEVEPRSGIFLPHDQRALDQEAIRLRSIRMEVGRLHILDSMSPQS